MAPIGHGAIRVEAGRFTKRACSLGVVETIGQVDALVEEQLGSLGTGGDGKGVGAQILQTRCYLTGHHVRLLAMNRICAKSERGENKKPNNLQHKQYLASVHRLNSFPYCSGI